MCRAARAGRTASIRDAFDLLGAAHEDAAKLGRMGVTRGLELDEAAKQRGRLFAIENDRDVQRGESRIDARRFVQHACEGSAPLDARRAHHHPHDPMLEGWVALADLPIARS